MKKRRIVIASLLKPVDDTRMFEKMATTLADSGDFEVFIIGYPSRAIPVYANVHFLPLKPFKRLSVSRLLARLKVLWKIRQVKPELLIVNTHDVLGVAIANRIFFGCPFYYDVRENYYRNIRFSGVYPAFIAWPLALAVRMRETVASLFVRHFFLAEKGYEKEMKFFGSRYTVLENKSTIVPETRPRSAPRGKHLLFSGTLAESTGVFRAIELAERLHTIDPTVRLSIVGYCARPREFETIQRTIAGKDYITLLGGSALVPHTTIIESVRSADFGIITYPPSPHTENSIPTKLYEYLACQLPILLEDRPAWVELCAPCQGAIPISFDAIDAAAILEKMKGAFYVNVPESVVWEGEKLLRVLKSSSR